MREPYTPDEVVSLLGDYYGRPEWRPHRDAMSELILTLLSQNTADSNSGRAFARLLQRFPDWQAMLDAPVSEIEDAIRPGGLAPTKAPRLQAILAEVRARTGGFDLRFLEDLPVDQAREWLRTLPAVGPKTAACVLLFALERPVMPVDTHVHRVARRLGIIDEKVGADQAHPLLTELAGPDDAEQVYAVHVGFVRHGRRICHARRPKCDACPLAPRCPSAGLV